MNTAVVIISIVFGCVGICSIIVSMFADKERKIKIKKMKKSIQRKKQVIESLNAENAFLRHAVNQHPDWLDDVSC